MTGLTPEQAGAKHSTSARRIQVLAKAGRIPGAKRHGKSWVIPAEFKVLPPPKRKTRGLDKLPAKN